jgi:hypothetical protein
MKPRETVELRRYQDGTPIDVFTEWRVVYTDKAGNRFVGHENHKRSPLRWDPDKRVWYWEIRFVTVTPALAREWLMR